MLCEILECNICGNKGITKGQCNKIQDMADRTELIMAGRREDSEIIEEESMESYMNSIENCGY